MSLRQMAGKGLAGGRGILDLLIGKHELGQALIKTGETHGIDSKLLQCLATWCKSHEHYRNDVGFKAGEKNTHWVSVLTSPNQKFLNLFQDV